MQDKELYQTILGLDTPWQVADVELDLKEGEIRVTVEHPRGVKFDCPECGCSLACFDHGEERRWRHLDSCQFKTILVGKRKGKVDWIFGWRVRARRAGQRTSPAERTSPRLYSSLSRRFI